MQNLSLLLLLICCMDYLIYYYYAPKMLVALAAATRTPSCSAGRTRRTRRAWYFVCPCCTSRAGARERGKKIRGCFFARGWRG